MIHLKKDMDFKEFVLGQVSAPFPSALRRQWVSTTMLLLWCSASCASKRLFLRCLDAVSHVQRTEVAALHAQRKVALLSSTPAEIVRPSDAARPDGF